MYINLRTELLNQQLDAFSSILCLLTKFSYVRLAMLISISNWNRYPLNSIYSENKTQNFNM